MLSVHYTYKTSGICARSVSFDIDEEGTVTNVTFEGGCNGNTQGVAALAEGMTADKLINTLAGITCGHKPTSCPDQLARAITEAKKRS